MHNFSSFGLRDHTTSQNGVAVIRQPNTLNLTSENYIGMSRGVVNSSSATEAVGSETVFESANTSIIASVYDSKCKQNSNFLQGSR